MDDSPNIPPGAATPATGGITSPPSQPSGGAAVPLTEEQREAISRQISETIYKLDIINFDLQREVDKLESLVKTIRENGGGIPVDIGAAKTVLQSMPVVIGTTTSLLFNNRTVQPIKELIHENGK